MVVSSVDAPFGGTRLRAVEDPAVPHRLIGDVLAGNSESVAKLAGLIRESVRAMKDERGLSYGQIAAELGLMRSRTSSSTAVGDSLPGGWVRSGR
ncbi:hypothetical protein Ae707Ps1_4266c [Pseudonocardia sp. Ae707_Ps1]|jgi:hypothetical protein|nr:hypothetical protein Ae707Ps1_4266c [Pseudonocardia sp. Ae707_Ps1]